MLEGFTHIKQINVKLSPRPAAPREATSGKTDVGAP
jgi:hypothetical protein